MNREKNCNRWRNATEIYMKTYMHDRQGLLHLLNCIRQDLFKKYFESSVESLTFVDWINLIDFYQSATCRCRECTSKFALGLPFILQNQFIFAAGNLLYTGRFFGREFRTDYFSKSKDDVTTVVKSTAVEGADQV